MAMGTKYLMFDAFLSPKKPARRVSALATYEGIASMVINYIVICAES